MAEALSDQENMRKKVPGGLLKKPRFFPQISIV